MGSKIPVSVLILTKDEEAVISRTVESCSAFDQVIVVDSYSSDATAQLARAAGAEVIMFRWDGRYPKKKQWSLQHDSLRHNWVLFVDADEMPSRSLVDDIRRIVSIEAVDVSAYDVTVNYHFMGRELKYGHRISKRVLVDRRRCHFPEVDDLTVKNMWEVEGHYQPICDGKVEALQSRLIHDDIDTLFDFIGRHNRYSDWEAHMRCNPQVKRLVQRSRSRQGRIFDRVPGKPVAFFLYSYVLRRGFLDGFAGFAYSISYSMYLAQTWLKAHERVA
ncbi:glycosyltransferase family 2 protein [Pseudonocardia sp. RS11V-5]|uniref:glycosyltransferase family 2 protein n=1 Tax=Pseudonocardia terrae TaxID=2905831 RepID=UPI001E285411|nr:glycosyltransferase family 2 protein [Pseudonocardia terrae]MCE3556438.1 glycosyltransferase family 2 protein [Pseudonocardia terrae]